MMFRTVPLLAVATGLVVAACTTAPTVEVTRFHLGQPTPADTIRVDPSPDQVPPGTAIPLEFRSYAAIVARDLAAQGFRPVETGPSAYVAILGIQQTVRPGIPQRSPFSIGIGGGTATGNVGIGGGVTVPIGGPRNTDVRVNELSVRIRRQSDNTAFWEGRAVQQIGASEPASGLSAAVPRLSGALFRDFPGVSGQTVIVKLR